MTEKSHAKPQREGAFGALVKREIFFVLALECLVLGDPGTGSRGQPRPLTQCRH